MSPSSSIDTIYYIVLRHPERNYVTTPPARRPRPPPISLVILSNQFLDSLQGDRRSIGDDDDEDEDTERSALHYGAG